MRGATQSASAFVFQVVLWPGGTEWVVGEFGPINSSRTDICGRSSLSFCYCTVFDGNSVGLAIKHDAAGSISDVW